MGKNKKQRRILPGSRKKRQQGSTISHYLSFRKQVEEKKKELEEALANGEIPQEVRDYLDGLEG